MGVCDDIDCVWIDKCTDKEKLECSLGDIALEEQERQKLFEDFLNASYDLRTELTNKLYDDQTYLTDKEMTFINTLHKWTISI